MEKVFKIILEKYQPKYVNKVKVLMEYLESLDNWEFQGIENEHGGHKEHLDFSLPWTNYEYVNQYENGGYGGDSYAGHVWLPIAKKVYLKFHYSM